MDILDSFYSEDAKGKTGFERTGGRLNLPKREKVDLVTKFVAMDLCTHENEDDARYGEKYLLARFEVIGTNEENEYDVLTDGSEYALYFELCTKTRKASAQAAEFKSVAELIADLTGESRVGILQKSGKKVVQKFLDTAGKAAANKKFRLYNVDSRGTGWYNYHAEAL